MADLAVLVTVSLDQLEVAVLPAGPLDFGLLDEHVATTLRTRSDGAIAHTDPQLPQHHSATRPPRTRAHQRPASQSPRATRPQTRKMGLANPWPPPPTRTADHDHATKPGAIATSSYRAGQQPSYATAARAGGGHPGGNEDRRLSGQPRLKRAVR